MPLGSFTCLSLFLSSLCLLGTFLVVAALFPRFSKPCAALVVGSGPRSLVMQERLKETLQHVTVRGCLDDEFLGSLQGGCPYLGQLDELSRILKAEPIQMVLIALPIRSKYAEIERVVRLCESVGVEVQYMSDLFTTSRARLQPHRHDPVNFTVLGSGPQSAKRHVKRAMDVVGASLLLLLSAPVMLVAAVAVRVTSDGPIFFVQRRYGHHRKQFPMFKFRTMVPDAERLQANLEAQNEASGPVFKLRSDPRLTPIGSFLRRFSIDELPQLFNVLRGEMSMVGPRPLPLRDVSHFEEDWLLRRFSIKPGLTCIWQISGRSETSFDNWIAQDLAYIDQWSLSLDLKILLLTIPSVLRGKGAM